MTRRFPCRKLPSSFFGSLTSFVDGYTVDATEGAFAPGRNTEVDGNPELETQFFNSGPAGQLHVFGTSGNDSLRVGRRGDVNFGADADVDVSVNTGATEVLVKGGGGNDVLTGQGNGIGALVGPATIPLTLSGQAGEDFITGGNARDILDGGNDRDQLDSRDRNFIDKAILGGFGFDTAIVETFDPKPNGVESVTIADLVGQLRLTPGVQRAEAGMISRLKLSWTHPTAWRELRKVQLRLYRGKQEVGTIDARPASGRLSGHGAIKLLAAGSGLSHEGATVTAKLAVRLPKSLAGEDLRMDVRATDVHGRSQLERRAATIHVAAER